MPEARRVRSARDNLPEDEDPTGPAASLAEFLAAEEQAAAVERALLAREEVEEQEVVRGPRAGLSGFLAEGEEAAVEEVRRLVALGAEEEGAEHLSLSERLSDPGFAASVERFVEAVQDALVEGKDAEAVLAPSTDREVQRHQRELVDRMANHLLAEHFNVFDLGDKVAGEIVATVVDDICGLGPIEHLMADEAVTEVVCRWDAPVLVERAGTLAPVGVSFRSPQQLRRVAQRIARMCNRVVDDANPICDAWLADGSRVNIALPPVSVLGPVVTIRKFPERHPDLAELVAWGALDPIGAELLRRLVVAKANIVVSGGTATGKTTVLRALARAVPAHEYLVTIEDTDELRLSRYCPKVTPLIRRERSAAGAGEVAIADLLRNALRMRPDRIIVGEVRGAEAFDMLQALSTGHEGGLSTVHANGPEEALTVRLPPMAAAAEQMPLDQARLQTNLAIDVVVQVRRAPTGERWVHGIYGVELDPKDPTTAHVVTLYERARHDGLGRLVAPATGRVADKLAGIEDEGATARAADGTGEEGGRDDVGGS
jgi:pilus assembly protein CpaF